MFELVEAIVTFGVLLQDQAASVPAIPKEAAAGFAVGLAALGAGIAERGIGAAAMGAIAEDQDLFGIGLILTVLPETLVLLALVTVFVI